MKIYQAFQRTFNKNNATLVRFYMIFGATKYILKCFHGSEINGNFVSLDSAHLQWFMNFHRKRKILTI